MPTQGKFNPLFRSTNSQLIPGQSKMPRNFPSNILASLKNSLVEVMSRLASATRG